MKMEYSPKLDSIKRWGQIPYTTSGDIDNGESKMEIMDFLFEFQSFYGHGSSKKFTSKENAIQYWIDQVDRCELDLVSPRLVYWTSKVRFTRINITPPPQTKN